MSSPTPGSPPTDGGHLRVTLLVTPSPKAGCAVLDAGPSGRVTMHETLRPGEACDGGCTCKAEATAATDDGPRLLEGNVTGHCVCPVFSEHDCLASVEGFEGDTLTISVAVPDREELAIVVAALRDRGATVRLKRISSAAETERRLLELDADAITDKQREAVHAAVEAGYYDTPRDADLSDLAAELGVSRSAVSQRLTAVESKLVDELARADDDHAGTATSD